ncbi:acyl-CoA synthetase [Rhodococcoides fascians]|uniref:acyl-CoA synthetase n=1 Tax=Rhodococcoides fascians TaxID=1828 RepID=UPI000561AB02|nr:long-chain fatty acid--CoA ligase [Rhodococcus fascians]
MDNFASILGYHADRRPDKVVLTHGDHTVTNRELLSRVTALAAALTALGVQRGDRVGVLLQNCPEFIELVFAANWMGAAILPLNYRLAPAEWEYILGHGEVKVLVSEPDFAAASGPLLDSVPSLRHLVSAAGDGLPTPTGWTSYNELIDEHRGADVALVDVGPDEMQRLMYTSGTTSRPKGVCITHRNMMYKNLGMLVQFGWNADEVTVVSGPLYHVGAMDMGGLTTLHAGGSLVLQTKFEANGLIDLIAKHQATSVWLAPAMVNAVLQAENLSKADLSSLRLIMSGGEKMPEARLRRILEVFPDLWFADAYGLTETVSSDTFVTASHMRTKLGSVGRPLPHVRVRVTGEDGDDVPAGKLGEIAIKGPKVFTGYWRDPAATRDAIRDGWFFTGDVGRFDQDGFLYIEDRKKDMIVSGGENIATPEVERVLYEHPDVLEAAVVGRPDARWGEVPHAFVVLKPGVPDDTDGLLAFCRKRLANFKAPKSVDFLDELPRTPSGKVLKRALRDTAVNPKETSA